MWGGGNINERYKPVYKHPFAGFFFTYDSLYFLSLPTYKTFITANCANLSLGSYFAVGAIHGRVENVCRVIPVIESVSKTQYEVKLGDTIKYYKPAVAEIKNYGFQDLIGTFIGIPNQFGYFFTQKDVFDISLPATEVMINGKNYMKIFYNENGNITITCGFENQWKTYKTVSTVTIENQTLVLKHIINGIEIQVMNLPNTNSAYSPYNGFARKRWLKMHLITLLFNFDLINENNEFFLYDINFQALFNIYAKPYSQNTKKILKNILQDRNTKILSRLVYDYETERNKYLHELERPPSAFVASNLLR